MFNMFWRNSNFLGKMRATRFVGEDETQNWMEKEWMKENTCIFFAWQAVSM